MYFSGVSRRPQRRYDATPLSPLQPPLQPRPSILVSSPRPVPVLRLVAATMLAEHQQSSSFPLQRFIMDRDKDDEDEGSGSGSGSESHPASSSRIVLRPPSDPDAQTTVNDFIDYTEYLPADLVRSMSLIRRLDESYLETTRQIHDLTKLYGALPTVASGPDGAKKPTPVELRKSISERLDRAVSLRECAYAEACRIYDVADRHFDRLNCIQSKLGDLTATVGLENPLANADAGDTSSAPATHATTKATDSDNAVKEKTHYRQGSLSRGHKASSQATSANRKELLNLPKHGSQRRSVAGAGGHPNRTSPHAKPVDPSSQQLGSENHPWLRLTEQELSALRTRLKKSRIWQPSAPMFARELAARGRGWDNYVQAKLEAETNQREFIDCDDPERTGVAAQHDNISAANSAAASSGDRKTNAVPDTTTQQSRKRKLEDVTHKPPALTSDVRLPRRSKINAASALSTTEPQIPATAPAPPANTDTRTRPRGNKKADTDRRKSRRAEERAQSGGDSDDGSAAESIDPNEPRYCICNDVSYGTMICCENDYCEKEWFHLECVGLSQVPGRAAKWYCPDCRANMPQPSRSRGNEVKGRKR